MKAPIGHLATADAHGAPHVIPVCYAFDGRAVYSVLDQKPKRTSVTRLRRVRNIQVNPKVALVVDHYEEDWGQLWYLLLMGEAELLYKGEEHTGAIKLLREKYPQYRTMAIDQSPVIRITPTRVVSWGPEVDQ
jgi:PPOX class probable F420-dependent enzyme